VAGALQLRSGFPPRADFEGGGRQRFLFFARPDAAHMIGFYVFEVGWGWGFGRWVLGAGVGIGAGFGVDIGVATPSIVKKWVGMDEGGGMEGLELCSEAATPPLAFKTSPAPPSTLNCC